MKKDVAKQHVALRDKLRKQFQDERISDADFLYESKKLFHPITESTEKALQKQYQPPPQLPPSIHPQQLALPAAAAAAPPQLQLAAASSKKKEYAVVDPDAGLDIELLEEMGFRRPSAIKDTDKYEEIIDKVNTYNKYVLGKQKRGSVTSDEKDEITEKINTNRDYVKRLRLLISGQDVLVTGKGLKMIGNKFGILSINRNELASGRLRALNGDGVVVMDESSDRSLYDLLTKKFSKTRKYSKNAIETFKKLAVLAGISLCDGRCPKSKMLSGGAIFYNDPNDLVNRLNLLFASKQAGNTGVSNEISDIIDELFSKAYISKDLAVALFNKNIL